MSNPMVAYAIARCPGTMPVSRSPATDGNRKELPTPPTTRT